MSNRWVLIPHEGCIECDSCTDALVFSLQNLSYWLSNETQDFKVSFYIILLIFKYNFNIDLICYLFIF